MPAEVTKTLVPEQITTPSTVEAGIGTLEFAGGYAKGETAEKLRYHLATSSGRCSRRRRVPARKDHNMKTTIAATMTTLILALSLAGCGEDEKPAVCSSVGDLKASVADVKKIDVDSGTALADLETGLKAVQSDLASVKADAKSEFSSGLDSVEKGLASLKTSLEAATATAAPATLAAVGAALSALGTDVEALISDIQSTC